MHFSGLVVALSGHCPTVSFLVTLTPVVTNADTNFKGGKCGSLGIGDFVTIDGTQSNGTVTATQVDLKGGDE